MAMFEAALAQPTAFVRPISGFIFESAAIIPAEAEMRLQWPVSGKSPLERFNHRWGLTVLELTLHDLEQEMIARKSESGFRKIRPFLDHDPAEKRERDAISMAFLRATRNRMGELLRKRLYSTLTDPANLGSEFEVLYGRSR